MTPSRALPRALGVALGVARRGVASDARATPRETSRASWALLLPSVAAGALGAWQLARREEKLAATTARAACLERVVDASRIRNGADDGARARVEGEMDLARTARVGPRARSVCGVAVPGSLIVTPVRLRAKKKGWFGRGASAAAGEAETVLLLRGWAPDAWTDADAAAGACAKTEGVVRGSERKGRFTPENEPGEDRWFWLDAPALAESRGLPRDAPLIQAIRAGSGDETTYPSAATKEELMRFPVSPEQHLGYAATWFALSAATGALAVVRIRRGVGRRF
jgi:surfeit locus 1 family protein